MSGHRGIRYLQPPQPGRKSTRTALSGLYPTGYQATRRSSQEKQAAAAIEEARPDSTSLFFQAAQGTEQFTVLENELVQLTFSNKGGRVSKALLKEYKDQKKQPLVLFDGEDASMNFGFEGKNENILSQQMYFEATNVTDSTVTMRLNAANGGHLTSTTDCCPTPIW